MNFISHCDFLSIALLKNRSKNYFKIIKMNIYILERKSRKSKSIFRSYFFWNHIFMIFIYVILLLLLFLLFFVVVVIIIIIIVVVVFVVVVIIIIIIIIIINDIIVVVVFVVVDLSLLLSSLLLLLLLLLLQPSMCIIPYIQYKSSYKDLENLFKSK